MWLIISIKQNTEESDTIEPACKKMIIKIYSMVTLMILPQNYKKYFPIPRNQPI